jgi:hypothetical protein
MKRLVLALRREPSVNVEVEPYPEDEPYVTPVSGENWVGFTQGRHLFLGMETSRHLRCIAFAGDTEVKRLRMELYRLGSGSQVLVAHTGVISAEGRLCFEFDTREEPIGREFLLEVTFLRRDGTTEVREETASIEDLEQFE